MKNNLIKLLKLLTTFFLLSLLSGCISKQSNGKYHSNYSYHPYYKMYHNKMSGENQSKYINIKSQKKYTKSYKRKVRYNDEDSYPSNVPANSH